MFNIKKYSLALLWTIFVVQFTQGQQKIDSLKQVLQSDIADTLKAKVYLDLAYAHINDSLKNSEYFNKALALSKRIGYQVGIIDAYNDRGLFFRRRNHYKAAIESYEKALALSQQIKDYQRVVNAYTNLGVAYDYSNNFPKAIECYQTALDLAQKIDFKDGMIRAYENFGIVYDIMGQTKKSLSYYQKSLSLKKKHRKEVTLAPTYNNIGNIYDMLGDYPKAIEYYQTALDIEKKYQSLAMMPKTLSNLGGTYRSLGNYVKALEYYQNALKIGEKVKNERDMATGYNKIGVIYEHDLKDYPEALKYYQKSLAMHQRIGNERGMAYALANLGSIKYTLNDLPAATKYFQQTLKIYTKIQEKAGIAKSLTNLGNVYQSQKKYDQALKYLLQSLQINQEINDKMLLVGSYNSLGQIYFLLKKYNQSREFLEKGKAIAQQAGYKQGMKQASQLLAQTYAAQGNYKAAYDAHIQFKQISDSLLNTDNVKKVTRLALSYTYEKKQDSLQIVQSKEKAILAADIRQRKTSQRALALGLGLSALLIITLALFYYSKQRSNRLLSSTNAQLLKLNTFKQQMMGMIVHDLKNPLNSIIGLSEKQKNPRFFHDINHSGRRMQTLIMNILDVQKLEESTLPLRENKVSLDAILTDVLPQVQFVAQEQGQTIEVQSTEKLIVKIDQELISRVLINLLTNASKFTPQNSVIQVQTEVTDDGLAKISVKDNGIGIAAEHAKGIFDKFYQVRPQKSGMLRSTGLGLTFCKLAIEAHQGQIGVDSIPGEGATFWFTLPLLAAEKATEELASSLTEEVITSDVLSFTRKELEVLQPIAQQIKAFDIFETSNITNALKTIDSEKNQNLQAWKKEIEDTMYTYNEVRFEELIDLVLG